ncbi:transposase [Streptomyces sp. NPDC005775]|uniref:transposase n=1 Tax=Streptomyces sp. NPDC005775 TaxID=3364729 RepID=UPI0036CAC0C2
MAHHPGRAEGLRRRGRPRGLPGLPDAINAAWPRATVQTCVIHLVRTRSATRRRPITASSYRPCKKSTRRQPNRPPRRGTGSQLHLHPAACRPH